MNETDEKLRAAFLEAHELSVELRGLADTARARAEERVSIPLAMAEQFASFVPLMAGYCLAALPRLREAREHP